MCGSKCSTKTYNELGGLNAEEYPIPRKEKRYYTTRLVLSSGRIWVFSNLSILDARSGSCKPEGETSELKFERPRREQVKILGCSNLLKSSVTHQL